MSRIFLILILMAALSIGAQNREVVVKFNRTISFAKSADSVFAPGAGMINKIFHNYHITRYRPLMHKISADAQKAFINYYLFELSSNDSAALFMTELNRNPDVAYAEPNYVFKAHDFPNDTLFHHQWALRNMHVPEAWNETRGDPSIIIGVIDTGVDYLHDDLRNQMWINGAEDLNHNGRLDEADINGKDDDGNGYIDDVIGWDFTDAPSFADGGDYLLPDNDPMDEYPGGHGTAVAGIIAAEADNTAGIAGIANGCKVMALRAGTSSGYLEEDDVAEAIVYAVQNGCRIINMSFGDVVYSHLIKDAVVFGSDHGVLFVASAGNEGNNELQFPASYDETISVGAIDSSSFLASFSSYGSKVDLVAPGVDILSLKTGNHYGEVNGTSFSAPMVSGALALIWSENPAANADKVRGKLISGCTDLGYAGRDSYFGNGSADVLKSLIGERGNIARIVTPATTAGLSDQTIPITGTASGSYMTGYSLSYGIGEMPLTMTEFYRGSGFVVNDTLGIWDTSDLPDSAYTIELTVTGRDQQTISDRVVVRLDRTAPKLDSLILTPVIIENYPGYLIRVESDDPTIASIHYRSRGANRFDASLTSGYFSKAHHFLLSVSQISGQVEFYLEFENSAGNRQIFDNGGQFYSLDLSDRLPLNKAFRKIDQEPARAYLLDHSYDFTGDGTPDAPAYISIPGRPQAAIGLVSYTNRFQNYFSSGPAFPRDFFDVDRDSREELLAGFGNVSYIFPGDGMPAFSTPAVQSTIPDFWAARMQDIDGDGQTELLAIHDNEWHIYQLDDPSDFSVTDLHTLQNPTGGDNTYGIPKALILDLNNDGKQEIIIGDYDGDLLMYRMSGEEQLVPIAMLRLKGVDATHLFDAGDLDGDGKPELVVATQKQAENLTESSFEDQYWVLQIIKVNPDNEFETVWQKNFLGVIDQKNTFNGLTVADYDADGRSEIFFAPYPHAYFVENKTGEYQISWYESGVNANAIPQMGTGRFLLSADSVLMIYEQENVVNRPLPPQRLRVTNADTHFVSLAWDPVAASAHYQLLRSSDGENTVIFKNIITSGFTDSTVLSNRLYTYQVETVDSSFGEAISYPGNEVTVRAESPPAIDTLEVVSDRQLFISFSGKLGEGSYQVSRYTVQQGDIRPTSAVRSRGDQAVVLTFLNPLKGGQHVLKMANLENEHNVPFMRDTTRTAFCVGDLHPGPYLRNIDILSKKCILLTFNHPLNTAVAENISNYSLVPDDHVVKARTDSININRVYLFLSGQNRIGSLGQDYYLEIHNIEDIWGGVMDETSTRFLLYKPALNLDDILVYPNPLRPGSGDNKISFGNVPDECEIFIFTAGGILVKTLNATGHNGGVIWDLKNDRGNTVRNGVYMFIAKEGDKKKIGKFLILK